MQRTVREVICDRCSLSIEDHFTGFKVKRLAGYMYDLCNSCYDVVELDIHDLEERLTNTFHSPEGRPIEEGDM